MSADRNNQEREALEWIASRDYYPPEAEECLIAVQRRARTALAAREDTERQDDREFVIEATWRKDIPVWKLIHGMLGDGPTPTDDECKRHRQLRLVVRDTEGPTALQPGKWSAGEYGDHVIDGGTERPKGPDELPAHIAQAQEEVRGKGLCGAIYDGPEGEVMCIRDPHTGRHARDTERPETGFGMCGDCGNPLTDREMLLGNTCDACRSREAQADDLDEHLRAQGADGYATEQEHKHVD